MHELSVALSIVEGAEERALQIGKGRVCAVHLKLGPLSGIVKEALLFSYGLACEGTLLEKSALVIEEVPVQIYCPACQAEQAPVSLQCLQCSRCGAWGEGITQGDELELTVLEVE